MVHFGTKLQANKISKWATHYVDYAGLKRVIKEIAETIEELRKRSFPLSRVTDAYNSDDIDLTESKGVVRSKSTDDRNLVAETVDESLPLLKFDSDYGSSAKTRSFSLYPPENKTKVTARATSASMASQNADGTDEGSFTDDMQFQKFLDTAFIENNPDKVFEEKIIEEVEKVQKFYTDKLAEFRDRIQLLRTAIVKMSKRNLKVDVDDDENLGVLSRELLSADSAKRAFQDVYRDLSYLHNYSILNYTAFIKILKKHDKMTGLKTKTQMIKRIHQYNSGFVNAPELLNLIQTTERTVAKAFFSNNLTLARSDLLMKHKPVNDWQLLHLGMRIGMTLLLAVWVLWDVAMDAWMKPDEPQLPEEITRIFRGFGYFALLFWLWTACVYCWNMERVNYIYLFEFDPRYIMHVEELLDRATTTSIVYLQHVLIYVKASRDEIPCLDPVTARFIPLTLVTYFISLVIFPLDQTVPFLEVLRRIILSPFFEVTFYSSFVADVLTSMAKPLVDIGFAWCFFLTGDWHRLYFDHKSMGRDDTCMHSFFFNRIITPLIISLPLLFRFIQNLRRYHDTGNRTPHLLNATKYALAHSLVLLGAVHPRYSSASDTLDPVKFLWVASFAVSTFYTYFWDVYFDWGLGDRSVGFLRRQRMYPDKRLYYGAMVLDLFLRFAWSLTLIPQLGVLLGTLGSSYMPMMLGWLELCRRAMWSVLRVEYEHLSNTQGYRRVDYVPLHFETSIHSKSAGDEKARSKFQVFFELFLFAVVVFAVALYAFISDDPSKN